MQENAALTLNAAAALLVVCSRKSGSLDLLPGAALSEGERGDAEDAAMPLLQTESVPMAHTIGWCMTKSIPVDQVERHYPQIVWCVSMYDLTWEGIL